MARGRKEQIKESETETSGGGKMVPEEVERSTTAEMNDRQKIRRRKKAQKVSWEGERNQRTENKSTKKAK